MMNHLESLRMEQEQKMEEEIKVTKTGEDPESQKQWSHGHMASHMISIDWLPPA